MLRAAVAALPASAPALPLAVLVASAGDMASGVQAWVARLEGGGAFAGRVGEWRVMRLAGADGVPDAGLLAAALLWLAKRAPAQPVLEVCSVGLPAHVASGPLDPAQSLP